MLRPAPAAFFACWLAIFTTLLGGASAKKHKDGNTSVLMSRHSLQPPLDHRALLDDWLVSGSSLFERERLLVHPAVPERSGIVWSRVPLKTGAYDIIVHLKVTGDKRPERFNSDQSFGLWVLDEDVAKNFDENELVKAATWQGMTKAGMTFAGSKAKFSGIGAVLTVIDADKRSRPSITFVSNDREKTFDFGTDVPTQASKSIDFRNTLNPAQVRLRVTPEAVEGHFKQSPSLSWIECFRMDRGPEAKVNVPETGYIGLTAWSGSGMDKGASDMVVVEKVEVLNNDENVMGEEMKDVAANIQEAYREMLTDENRHFIDQKSQREHLTRLTTMVQDYLAESRPVDESLLTSVSGINSKLQTLQESCQTLAKEVEVLVNPAGQAGAGDLKHGIKTLTQVLHKSHETHKKKLDDAHKTVKEVKTLHSASSRGALKELAEQSNKMETTVSERSSQMTWMLAALIISVLVVGLLMYNRIDYYEKKHFV